MKQLFEMILQNSLIGSVFIIIILFFRQATKNMPKIYVHCLWMLLLAELLVPPVIHTPFYSLRNVLTERETETSNVFRSSEIRQSEADMPVKENPVKGTESKKSTSFILSEGAGKQRAETVGTSDSIWKADRPDIGGLAVGLYLMGMFGMTLFFMLQYWSVKRRVRMAVRTKDGVWESGRIEVPFVMPGIIPRIYLPTGVDDTRRVDIVAHEKQHIRHMDHWIKLIMAAALILHWFNPLVWLACRMMNKDMEMFCDERVLKGKSFDEKKRYTQSLLDFAVKSGGLSLTLNFGESNTKTRIKHILNAKRPRFFLCLLLVCMIFVCGVFFLTAGGKNIRRTEANCLEHNILKQLMPASEINPSERTVLSGEEENDSVNPIAGMPFVPDSDLAERIKAAGDYTDYDKWRNYQLCTEAPAGSQEEEEFYKAVNKIGQSGNFVLYGMYDFNEEYGYYDSVMLVQTPEGGYIKAEKPFTSNYMAQPRLLERDFDGDGTVELAVATLIYHGTGVCVESLHMADQAADGSWYLFEFRSEDLDSQLALHYATETEGENVRFVLDGTKVGLPIKMGSEQKETERIFCLGDQISFTLEENGIKIEADAAVHTNSAMGEYYGHGITAGVIYHGEGNFKLTGFSYRDSELESRVEGMIYYFYAGNTDRINEIYAADGFTLKEVYENPAAEEPVIADIRYDVDSLESGMAEVTVTVIPPAPNNDSYEYVTLRMQAVLNGEERYDDTGIWKLTELWVEK